MIRIQMKWPWALAALLLAGANLASAEPTRPADDTLVLASTSATGTPAQGQLRAAQAALAGNPQDMTLALEAARLAIEEGRTTADPRRYGQAQAALGPWWEEADPPTDIRVLRAVIRQAFHDFAGATADLDAILEAAPSNAQARLSRAFVKMVTGDTESAAADCAGLPASIAPIVAQICKARLEALTGKGEQARQRLTRVLAVGGGSNAAMRRFAVTVLADLTAGLGDAENAVRLYGDAASGETADAPLLAAFADQLLDMGRSADALSLLDGKGEADILLLRRAIAAKGTGDRRLAQWQAILDERFAAAAAGGVRVHLREEARYRLEVKGDTAAALDLALANWQVQKEPADARLLLDCARAAGKSEAAVDVRNFIARTRLADARVLKALASLEATP